MEALSRPERLSRFFSMFRTNADVYAMQEKCTVRLERFFEKFASLNLVLLPEPIPDKVHVDTTGFQKFLLDFAPVAQASRRRGDFIDVWDLAGLRHIELRNAGILAWLLDANQTHGTGSAILLSLIAQMATHHDGIFPLPKSNLGNYSVSTECYPLGNAENRVDIIIDGTDFVAFIEVKIGAVEDIAQIKRYLELAKAKAKIADKRGYAVVFLSPKCPTHNDCI